MLLPDTLGLRTHRTTALGIALLWLAACCLFLIATESPEVADAESLTSRSSNDLALYQAVVDRVADGEDYYAVLGDELASREYPLLPVFNWRTPLHLGLLATVATPVLQMIALAIALLALCLQMRWAELNHLPKAFSYLAAALAAPALCVVAHPMAIYFPEFWAGLLIWTSICCYGNRWAMAGSIAALAALFFRELAAVYILVVTVLALRERNRRELTILCLGLVAYSVYYYLHFSAVQNATALFEQPHTRNWFAFGGAGFLQDTVGMYPLFMVAPPWLKALVVPTALIGAFACPLNSARHAKWTLGSYVLFFSIAGLPFNYYWGALYTAVVAWGLAWFIPLGRNVAGKALEPSKRTELA